MSNCRTKWVIWVPFLLADTPIVSITKARILSVHFNLIKRQWKGNKTNPRVHITKWLSQEPISWFSCTCSAAEAVSQPPAAMAIGITRWGMEREREGHGLCLLCEGKQIVSVYNTSEQWAAQLQKFSSDLTTFIGNRSTGRHLVPPQRVCPHHNEGINRIILALVLT